MRSRISNFNCWITIDNHKECLKQILLMIIQRLRLLSITDISIDSNRRLESIEFRYRFLAIDYNWHTGRQNTPDRHQNSNEVFRKQLKAPERKSGIDDLQPESVRVQKSVTIDKTTFSEPTVHLCTANAISVSDADIIVYFLLGAN